MPQLDFNTYISQIFWLVVFFGLLYVIVSNYIAPKIFAIQNKRHHRIDGDNKTADGNFARLEQLKLQIVKNKQAVIDDVNNIYKFGLKDFAKHEDQKLQDLQQELAHRAQEYNAENESYIQSLHNEIQATTVTHAASMISHVANIKNIDHELPKYLVEAKHDDV